MACSRCSASERLLDCCETWRLPGLELDSLLVV
ncbi:hypothetical protein T01_10628 [Trichinella spiralis]|uniref:Uncharacterized protein n=1 Tax=Trichinella spiralis TaxID=6334 RepID=A0A0V1ALD9_TRISP|nr:hypothetical protein T01_10628 [Trichinella spiralis]